MQDALAARLLNPSGIREMDPPTQLAKQKMGGGSSGENVERLQAVAKEFEALFLSYMLSVMRETISESGLTEKGLGAGIYTELFDQEVARSLASRGALGISDMLMRKLTDQVSAHEPGSGQSDKTMTPPAAGKGIQAGGAEEIPDFRMPVQAQVSSDFGLRKDPFTHQMRMHRGVDIAAPEGMAVQAACAGRVISSGYEKGYGNTVVVRHPGGYETRYAHLGTSLVNAGDQIPERGVLGTVGSTGRSTGSHLHFEVSRYGDRINPMQLLP